jgi:hypothetical protein
MKVRTQVLYSLFVVALPVIAFGHPFWGVGMISIGIGELIAGSRRPKRNDRIVCAHCHRSGCIMTSIVERKVGVSGGKATAAILTGGVSLLATGLARKELATQIRCSNCQSVYYM